jgi:hypothetical protein
VQRQRAQRRALVGRVLGHEHDVERRPVVDEDLPVAVVDHAARRRDAHEPRAVVLGELPHLRPLHDLQEP